MHESKNKSRTVLMMGDGGIRAGFVAGAADKLMELVPDFADDIRFVYGSSASAGNSVYFSCFGLKHPGKEMWTRLLSDDKFIAKKSIFSSEPVYNIDYMINKIFREVSPLDLDKLKSSSIGFAFPILNMETNSIKYIVNDQAKKFLLQEHNIVTENYKNHDIYSLIAAASSPPFVYDRPVYINGEPFIDAAPIAPSLNDLQFPEDTKFVFIFCRKDFSYRQLLKYFLTTFLFLLLVLPFRKKRFKVRNYIQYALKPLRMKKAFAHARHLEKLGKAVLVYPSKTLGSMSDNSAVTLSSNYSYGENVAEEKATQLQKLYT